MGEKAVSTPRWLVLGHEATLEWSQSDGVYVARLPSIPGCRARGADRAEALGKLAAAIERRGPRTRARG